MNPILSVFLKDFLIVPDEVVDGLYARAEAGELSDEVDVTDAGLADEIDEQAAGVELYLARLRGEG